MSQFLTPLKSTKELFKGTVVHSIDYRNAWDWKTKHGLIVGSANTGTGFLLDAPNSITQANFLPAHDIAEDMLDAGLSSVTMIQRGETGAMSSRR
jgi:cation diffusion facilitator CzcD-associated flavoprotein CzcO